MVICCDVRRTHQIRPARVDDDELCAFPQTLFHPRSEDRMRVRWIAADDEDDVGIIDGVEILGSRRRAEGLAQSIAGRRMADSRASVDIIVTETAADQLLNEIGLFRRAA